MHILTMIRLDAELPDMNAYNVLYILNGTMYVLYIMYCTLPF